MWVFTPETLQTFAQIAVWTKRQRVWYCDVRAVFDACLTGMLKVKDRFVADTPCIVPHIVPHCIVPHCTGPHIALHWSNTRAESAVCVWGFLVLVGEFCLPSKMWRYKQNLQVKSKQDENKYENRVDLCNCLKMSVRQFKDPRGLFSQTLGVIHELRNRG